MAQSVASLLDTRSGFADRLAECLVKTGACAGAAGFVCKDGVESVASGPLRSGKPFLSTTRIPALCLIKPLTTTLIAMLAERGDLTFEDDVANLLNLGAAPSALVGVTLRHLLTHSHGLPEVWGGHCDFTQDGRIDVEALLSRLRSSDRLCAPGTCYSYGDFGFMLAGAVIESVTAMDYASVLHGHLLDPLGIARPTSTFRGRCFCPSTGQNMVLSLADLLSFLDWHLFPERHALPLPRICADKTIFDSVASPPGFTPSIKGASLGWMIFKDGWRGHDGTGGWVGAQVRLHLPSKTAIAFVGYTERDRWPLAACKLLFQHTLPRDEFPIKLELAAKTQSAAGDISAYQGHYTNGRRRFCVRPAQRGEDGSQTERAIEIVDAANTAGALYHQNGGLFRVPSRICGFQLIQFLDRHAGQYRAVWDGQQLWSRTTR